MNHIVNHVKPIMATGVAVISTGSQAAVMLDIIHGWAAVITVHIGVPTAALIFAYWIIKFRKAWKHRADDVDI